MEKLEAIKKYAHHYKEHDFFTTVQYEDYLWLIEQAEIASNYGSLVMEHADLFHFKQIAEKHLTAEQLESIQEEMENIPETGF
ncbi:hypothetical protein ACWNS2_13895 [Planococcus plakortidis]